MIGLGRRDVSSPFDASPTISAGVTGNFIAPHEVRLMEAFALGRMIRILAILDGIILLLNCAYFTVLFLMLWVGGPPADWSGASHLFLFLFFCLRFPCLPHGSLFVLG